MGEYIVKYNVTVFVSAKDKESAIDMAESCIGPLETNEIEWDLQVCEEYEY
jgi:hypothetical protein